MDVLPLSLGIELVDGTYSVIIPKNTPLPVKKEVKNIQLILRLIIVLKFLFIKVKEK
jgi:molecular chaperone DnaK (HSP70)